jgi:hypothetical protein
LKAELARHDTLANRGRVNYETYSTEEKNMKLEEIDNNGKQTLHLQLK